MARLRLAEHAEGVRYHDWGDRPQPAAEVLALDLAPRLWNCVRI
jgi:hypothetical protein